MNKSEAMIVRKLKTLNTNLRLFYRSLKLVFLVSPRELGLLIGAILVQGLAPSLAIWLSAFIIDQLANPDFSTSKIALLCLIWAGSLFITNILQPLVVMWQSNISDLAVNKVNQDIIQKANSIVTLSEFENPEFHNDIQVLQTQASHKPLNLVVTIIGLVRDFIIIASCIALMSAIIPWIGIVALVGAYVNYRVIALLQQKTWNESLGRSQDSRLLNYLTQVALGSKYAKEVRLFNMGSYLACEYKSTFARIFVRIKELRIKQVFWPILPFALCVAGNLLAFYMVVTSAKNGMITIGSIALFLQGLASLNLHIASFGEQAGWVKGHLLFFEKLFHFLGRKNIKLTHRAKIQFENQPNNLLVCQNISYHYPNGNIGIQDVNLEIIPGQKIAIVGKNGSGKSTLIKLICGLYLPSSGQLLVNNETINAENIASWQPNISPVFQDFNSYSFSLERNIAIAEEIDQTKLELAISRVGIKEDLEAKQIDPAEILGTDFGNSNFSMGQWQKIAIARALYKDAPIFILDEPTASLDPFAEAEIYKGFAQISQGKTVIYVTHRLNSVVMADRILLLDKGQIIADGNHLELMNSSDLYREMFLTQARNYLPAEELV